MIIKIKIVTYEDDKGEYRSFNDITFEDWQEAVDEANRLHKLTGKCCGVFNDRGHRFTTSNYYANLPEGV